MLAHEHSGRIRHHQHTSYAGLTFALLLTGVLLAGSSLAAQAAPPAVNPQSGSVGLSGVVKGPPPSTAAVILTPPSNTTTTTSPITLSGVCPQGTFVTVTKNDVFGGVTTCDDDGTFSLLVDLFEGQNKLVAQVSDVLGQLGPPSNPIYVYYDSPRLRAGGQVGQQLFLEAATTVMGTDPAQTVRRTVTIVGGAGPYAINWDWGDGESNLASEQFDGAISADHAYKKAGTYRVIIKVTDAVGNAAYLQLITVVNGPAQKTGATSGQGTGSLSGTLIAAWPLYLLAALMVLFFWLGEKREGYKLRKHLRVGEAI